MVREGCGPPATILQVLRPPFSVENLNLEIGASMGIAVCSRSTGWIPIRCLRRAEIAMDASRAVHGEYAVFSLEHDQYSPARLVLAGELRRAIECNDLVLFYQPQFNCRSGEIQGVEALVRWEHAERGRIMPDQFIPLAERTGLVKPMTYWVLNEALRQQQAWRQEGFAPTMSVNVSARNLVDPELVDRVGELLEHWDADPEWVNLEITESAVMEDRLRATDTLARLHHMGFQLSIDDFGTGYSSLAYLKNLPVDEIKIDKSFVINMGADPKDAAIVHTILELGQNLGMRVVAEGVDNAASWSALRVLGCNAGQGYYLAMPAPAAEVFARKSSTEPFTTRHLPGGA